MDFLIHLFHTIITYPTLNLFMLIYAYIHDFGLTILLLTCLAQVCFVWPLHYQDMRRDRNALQVMRRSFATLIGIVESNERDDPEAMQETMKESLGIPKDDVQPRPWLTAILAWLNIYIIVGMYFMLAVLGGSSLQAINSVLYALIPRLSALPNYEISLPGQTLSLVHPGVFLVLLLVLSLTSLANAYLSVRRIRKTADVTMQSFLQSIGASSGEEHLANVFNYAVPGWNMGCTFLLAALTYPLIAGSAILFASLFASGVLLIAITFALLDMFTGIFAYWWIYR